MAIFTLMADMAKDNRPIRTVHSVTFMDVAPTASEYTIDIGSLIFKGDATEIDKASAMEIYHAVSEAVIIEAIMLGRINCPANCKTPQIVKVFVQQCVMRSGSGLGTRFLPFGPQQLGYREYAVCQPPGGEPVVVEVPIKNGVVAGMIPQGCEYTCPV